MQRIKRSIQQQRGTSSTEALVVLVLGILIAGGAVAVLAPGLTSAAAQALQPLGVSYSPEASTENANAIWYVVFAFLGFGFLGFFVAPMLFPKARSQRESVLSSMSGTFPVLQVFIDQDKRVDKGLNELRQLGDDVKRMQGTPMSGSPAVRAPQADDPIVVDAAGVGASEEPTVSRSVPSAGGPPPNRAPRQTGKEAAIAAIPDLEPLGTASEEPTVQVSRGQIDERLGQAPRPVHKGGGSPIIRRLEGVRAADYKAPEPVVGDSDATLVRSSGKLDRPVIDDLDEPTNVLPDRKSILARAAALNDAAGPDDPTHLRSAFDGDEDLRETIAQPVTDPAGPDADTNELFGDG